MFVLTQEFLEPCRCKPSCLQIYRSLNNPSLCCSFVGNSSHLCRSDGSATSEYGAQSTQSLGHKGAPLSGFKPQTNKVGTLPRRRDTGADGRCFSIHAQCSSRLYPTPAASNATNRFYRLPNDFISPPLHSPHAGHEVPAQCGSAPEQLVGSCSLGPL